MRTKRFVKITITIIKSPSKSQSFKFDDQNLGEYAESWSKKGLFLSFTGYLIVVM